MGGDKKMERSKAVSPQVKKMAGQMLSVLRFIPLGQEVSRIVIHLLFLIFL